MGVSIGLPVNRMWNGGSDLQAGMEIYHWGYLRFWLIFGNQNDPLLGPQFHPPRVVSSRSHISMPMRSLDLYSDLALRYRSKVLPPILCAIGLALAERAARGKDSNSDDFGIMTPRGEAVAP